MISFIFPIYKQEHVLRKSIIFLEEFLNRRRSDQYEVVICIDGSPDNCRTIAEDLAKEFSNVVVIAYAKNQGRGFAVKYGGLKARGEYLIYMDCDLLTKEYVYYLETMLLEVKRHDVVIASRFHKDARIQRKAIRKFVSQCYRALVDLMFRRFTVTDPDVGFKGFKKDIFNQINLISNLNGFSWDLQFLVNAQYDKFDVYEFPFDYIENYERTTVNVLASSFNEFLGMVYVRITRFLIERIIF